MLNRDWLGVDSAQSIPSQLHFDTTSFRHNVSFLKIVDLELDTDADEYGCLRKRKVSATAAVPKKVQRQKLRTISAIPFPVEPFGAKVMEFECYRKRQIAEVDN